MWRRLKRLGALLLHDAVWVLPATPYTVEQFQWLADEISEMDGSALVWEAHLRLAEHDAALVARFVDQAEGSYRELLADLARPDVDLTALAKRYQQVQALDYFPTDLGRQARAALIAATERGEP